MAPNFTAVELITDGDASGSGTAWTFGTGWSDSGTTFTATAGSASDLSQSISLNQNAWHILDVDVVTAAGTVIPYWGTTAIGAAITATGTYKRTFYCAAGGSQTFKMSKSATYSGSVDNISVQVLATANAVTNAPTSTYWIFTTAEGICVALGANDSDGNFDPLLVKWSDTWGGGGANSFAALQTWTSTNANAAGDKRVSKGTRLVAGCAIEGFNIVWTDSACYFLQFSADPSIVYRLVEIAGGAGLMGPNAFVVEEQFVRWVAPDGGWYQFNGGAVAHLPNTCQRWFFDNLTWTQQDKVFGCSVSSWNNSVWYFPFKTGGNENSRYLIHCPGGAWANGTFTRTAQADAGVLQFGVAADSGGQLWYDNKGDSIDGGTMTWHLEGSYIGNGPQYVVNGMRPDHEDLLGGYTVQLTSEIRDTRGIHVKTTGQKSISGTTGKVNFRVGGESVKVKWRGNTAPTFWKMGNNQFDIVPN